MISIEEGGFRWRGKNTFATREREIRFNLSFCLSFLLHVGGGLLSPRASVRLMEKFHPE